MAQKLILFENIVNGKTIKSNKSLQAELEKLAEYVFGESDYEIEDAKEKGDEIQGWCNDELYKAIVNDYCTAFRFKSAFEVVGEGYAGPVMGWFFEPDGALDDQIVVLTCESNGLFKNPRYVCGLLMDEDDLERLLGDLGKEVEDEEDEDEEDWDDEEDDEDEDDDVTAEEKNEGTKSFPEFSKDDFVPSGNVNGHDFVDLGLPSGLKWATCNIGASSSEEYGDYFAWGETAPKNVYSEDSYELSVKEYDEEAMEYMDEDEDEDYYAYYEMVNYGNNDIKEDEEGWKRNLNPEDDAAAVNWKGLWRMPNEDDFQELIDNCECTWGMLNQSLGVKVTGPNGHCIFLPSAGSKWDEDLEYEDECNYWSSSLNDSYERCNGTEHTDYYDARILLFSEKEKSCTGCARNAGLPIRPVCSIDDEKKRPESEEINDDKLKSSVLRAIQEIKEKEANADKGDIILKLVSYNGSVIKMMTALSSIDGIDEEAAFSKLQKLPAVVLEGITAKKAMEIGAMLEEAGATVDLARASDPVPEEVVQKPAPKPVPEPTLVQPEPAPEKPKPAPMEYVDLGLSVKWAKCNLGASAPEEFGDYYAWGETEKHDRTAHKKYKFFSKGRSLSKYNTKETYGEVVDNIKQLELSDDAAHQVLGGGWRMPTMKEVEELKKNCKVFPATINGVKGLKVVSKIKGYTDKWIFLPAAGYIYSDRAPLIRTSYHSFYWTSSLYTRRPDCALAMFCDDIYEGKMDREDGLSIRAVTK